jgi:anti-anti-sigma factor
MSEALTIRVQRDRGYAIVAVAGGVDIATVTRLRESLFGLTASGRTLVVDLDQVSFIDPPGSRRWSARPGVPPRTGPACR